MPQRTFAKMYKATYDVRGTLTRLGTAADLLGQYDPDQRSTGKTKQGRREFRKAATQYRGARKRLDALMTKFGRFDVAVNDRINAVLATKVTTTGKRGRPKGSKNKTKRGRKSTAKTAE